MRSILALLLAAAAVVSTAAHAGRSCEPQKPTVATVTQGLQLAQRAHEALEAAHARDGTRVVFLARAGQDLRKYDQHYSHMAIAWRTATAQGHPAWRVLHKLNTCGSAESAIYRQGLGEFFLDDLWRYEAAWSVPAPQVQARLVTLLAQEGAALRMHHKGYSMVSYPWSTRYQQSNQWVLETLALASDPAVNSRERAQAWLQLQGYEPAVLKLGPLTRMGARATAANVAFDDHPDAKRFADRIETVTVDSVFAWLQRSGFGGAPVRLH
jgi:hypothetical protein